MRVMMSTPPVLGTPVETQPIMARMAELEVARMMEQTEPETMWPDEDGEPETRSGFRHGGWLIEACLADSLRAFDTMTIDDLAALQTAR
jgi:hypothetical protein